MSTVPQEFRSDRQFGSEKQQKYIKDLLTERGLLTPEIEERIPTLSKKAISAWIQKALTITPKIWPDIPDGHYAVTGDDGTTDFYRIQTGAEETRWAGRRFLHLQLSDNYERVGQPQRSAVIRKIMDATPQAAMIRYGREIGRCGVCNRTLTNPLSIELGIGPVCRGEMGW